MKLRYKTEQINKYSLTSNRGITIIALIVTIVILVILATVSINVVLGENGITEKTQAIKESYDNSIIAQKEEMNTILAEYRNTMEKSTIPEPPYEDATLATAPNVTEGMTKVKYDSESGKWKKVTDNTEEWYNYSTSKKEWANVVLGDATFNSDGTLDESAAYTQLVWIPRYAYKITSMYHTSGTGAGDIEVVLIGTDNKGKDGTQYSTTYPSATAGTTTGMDDYVVHPAFDYGDKHLAGFWVGKFESSNTSCTTDSSTGEVSYTGNEVMTVKAGVTSWRNLTINQMFNICLNMNKEGNPYGLSTDDNKVDPHLTKNDEWGAVAYLSKSKYGKETEEVYINNSSTFITGNAGSTASASSSSGVTNAYNTTNGMKASTTGNIYGVYDMSGGAVEYTGAYIDNENSALTDYGESLVAEGTTSRYINVYSVGTTDSRGGNYAESTPKNGHYGDAVYETSSSGDGVYSWYNSYSNFPNSVGPFFIRGGRFDGTSNASIFYFYGNGGSNSKNSGMRVVVSVF